MHRWYGDFLTPVSARVSAARARIPGGEIDVPLAGFYGALVVHVARGWGDRRWEDGSRVAVALLETANQLAFLGVPAVEARGVWLGAQLRPGLDVARRLVARERMLLRRVAARVVGSVNVGGDVASAPVLFLRAAVAAGVVVGAVPDGVHVALDAWARAFGASMAAASGGAASPAANGMAALAALADLPDAAAKEALIALTEREITSDTVPPHFSAWRPYTISGSARAEDALTAEIRSVIAASGPVPDAARAFAVAGGKRFRARVAMAAMAAVCPVPTAESAARARTAGAHVEWLHAASLVIDDIVDEAELRRGVPALHRTTDPIFALGTAAYVMAVLADASPSLVDVMFALAEGQRAELARAADPSMTISEWYTIAGEKTARLFSVAATLGAEAAGATKSSHVRALSRYGHELGLAFQIIDDLLDVTGTENELGKRPGNDARAGRIGFPELLARENPDADSLATRCRERARGHANRAVAAIADLPGDTSELRDLARLCVERSA